MKASDVMVSKVITIGPDATVPEVADLLLRHRISAVPVVGANDEILGIVSEGDLINRPETQTSHRKSWWLEALASNEKLAAEYVKSHSRKAADVMTCDVIWAVPDTSIAEVAALLEKNRIKRVPIVQNGKIVGMVSRANLLQGLASLGKNAPQSRPDDFRDPRHDHGQAEQRTLGQSRVHQRYRHRRDRRVVGHRRVPGGTQSRPCPCRGHARRARRQ